jgi:hypothetical protein
VQNATLRGPSVSLRGLRRYAEGRCGDLLGGDFEGLHLGAKLDFEGPVCKFEGAFYGIEETHCAMRETLQQ